jgi:hypothetical protein
VCAECLQGMCHREGRGRQEERSAHLLFESLSLVHRVRQLRESVRMLSSDLQRRGREGKGENEGRGKIEIFGAGGEDVKIKIDQDPESRSKVPHHEHFESLHHALLASMGLREWGYLRGKERSKEKAKKEQEN